MSTPNKGTTTSNNKDSKEKANYSVSTEYVDRDFGITGAVLYAANELLGQRCTAIYDDFTLCKGKYDNPEKCLKEGELVTKCAIETFHEINKLCQKELIEYSTCLDKKNMDFNNCRKEQSAFKTCALPLSKPSSIEVQSPEKHYNELLHRLRSPVIVAPPKDV